MFLIGHKDRLPLFLVLSHRGVLDEKVNFIQKPFTLATLAAKVRAILDQPSS